MVIEPRSYRQRGRQAVFADPEGAVFGGSRLQQRRPARLPRGARRVDLERASHAKDPDKDAAFYQTLFGYDVFDVPSDDGLQHVILSSDDYARASVNALPSDSSRRSSSLAQLRPGRGCRSTRQPRSVSLGGRVLVEPHVDRHGGRVAVVADPTGAPFGLMEWSDTDSKTEPK